MESVEGRSRDTEWVEKGGVDREVQTKPCGAPFGFETILLWSLSWVVATSILEVGAKMGVLGWSLPEYF
jgi:hypothetical protein